MPRRSSAVVLMYHSVEMPEASKYIDPAWSMTLKCFERQIRFLARRRHVIPLSELVELLKNGREPKPGSVVLTFDDGYKDNFYVVAPILRHYGLPATISLATDYVTSGENQPIDRLYAIFRTHTRARIKLPFSDGVEVNTIYDLRQPSHWKLAYQICAQQLSQSTREQREQILAYIEQQLEPTKCPPRLILNWQEVRELTRQYPEIEIGAHTAQHVDLSVADAATIREELRKCIEDLEREMGVRPRHFCFPYGRSNSLARRLVAEAGFESAMGPSGPFAVDASTSAYCLPRVNAHISGTQLKFYTHPGFTALPRWLARRG